MQVGLGGLDLAMAVWGLPAARCLVSRGHYFFKVTPPSHVDSMRIDL